MVCLLRAVVAPIMHERLHAFKHVYFLVCDAGLSVLSILAIILLMKREPAALLLLYPCCNARL